MKSKVCKISVRVTADEYNRIMEHTAHTGLDLSTFARYAMLKELPREIEEVME